MTTEDLDAAKMLAPYFDAARMRTQDPSVALLSAIIADAAAVQAARNPPPPAWRRLLDPARRTWPASAALAACALLGFWVGVAGTVSIDPTSFATTLSDGSTDADPVATFLELAAME